MCVTQPPPEAPSCWLLPPQLSVEGLGGQKCVQGSRSLSLSYSTALLALADLRCCLLMWHSAAHLAPTATSPSPVVPQIAAGLSAGAHLASWQHPDCASPQGSCWHCLRHAGLAECRSWRLKANKPRLGCEVCPGSCLGEKGQFSYHLPHTASPGEPSRGAWACCRPCHRELCWGLQLWSLFCSCSVLCHPGWHPPPPRARSRASRTWWRKSRSGSTQPKWAPIKPWGLAGCTHGC